MNDNRLALNQYLKESGFPIFESVTTVQDRKDQVDMVKSSNERLWFRHKHKTIQNLEVWIGLDDPTIIKVKNLEEEKDFSLDELNNIYAEIEALSK